MNMDIMKYPIVPCPKCNNKVNIYNNGQYIECPSIDCDWYYSKSKYEKEHKMSDAITDVERDAKRIRLQSMSQERLINDCKESFKSYCQCKKDLVALGYHITESFDSIKIWKEY